MDFFSTFLQKVKWSIHPLQLWIFTCQNLTKSRKDASSSFFRGFECKKSIRATILFCLITSNNLGTRAKIVLELLEWFLGWNTLRQWIIFCSISRVFITENTQHIRLHIDVKNQNNLAFYWFPLTILSTSNICKIIGKAGKITFSKNFFRNTITFCLSVWH